MERTIQEKFNDNELSHKEIMEEVKELGKNLNRFEVEITNQISRLPLELQEQFDARYASKDVERLINKVVWLVVSGVIVSLLGVVLIDRVIK